MRRRCFIIPYNLRLSMNINGSFLGLLFLGVFVSSPLRVVGEHDNHAAHSQSQGNAPLPLATEIELQPLAAQVKRLVEALELLGEPLQAEDRAALSAAMASPDMRVAVASIQRILDPHCLFEVSINPEMRVSVQAGSAKRKLVEQGWHQFLVKVVNECGATSVLRVTSPNALSVNNASRIRTDSDIALHLRQPDAPVPPAADAWLDLRTYDAQPMQPALSGLGLEYRIVQLYSRDAGNREAKFSFDVGQGDQDPGFRSELDLLFECRPARVVTFNVLDEGGLPTTGSFVIRDLQGRIYPSQVKRLAPDLTFQPQIYRADGETIHLPDGKYHVEFQRGPESEVENRDVIINGEDVRWTFQVKRWIDPAMLGWWSGDHHIHAAGCAHYSSPTEGILAADMERQIRGEDLKIGANLTWGPGFDYQKQFFTGRDDIASVYPYLIHYDIEVSGYGAHRSGHLCLLRLREQIFPGGDSSTHWPTLGLNIIRWAKAQGALVGTAHSGLGLGPPMMKDVKPMGLNPPRGDPPEPTDVLPNYIIPPYSGVGANEYVVNVTHEVPGPDGKLEPAYDFYALVDTPHTWELNMWYHSLNAGFRTRASGETDFPCLYGDRVGMGRSYVKLDGKLSYDAWCEGIRAGRSYVSDGKSHLLDFRVNERAVGEQGSELRLAQPTTVKVRARVAALLDVRPNHAIGNLPQRQKPWWNLERARIGESREVPVEVIVNGIAVAQKNAVADGTLRDIEFDIPLERSSWIALRIRASSHTNPVFILVGGKPIRPSRRSVEWCLRGVDQCWSQKQQFIAPAEMADALAAYEHARVVYRARMAECEVE